MWEKENWPGFEKGKLVKEWGSWDSSKVNENGIWTIVTDKIEKAYYDGYGEKG